MMRNKLIVKQLTKFHKIIDDFQNILVNLDDKDKTVLLLGSLPRSFKHFKDVTLFGKECIITLEEVRLAIRTR